MNRKRFLQAILAVPLAASIRLKAAGPQVQVYKTPTCSCCGKWVQHLRNNGFEVSVQDVADTTPYRRRYGVPETLGSCHTAVVEGYAIEGHVPASEIQRLLRERPKAKGLAVAGMPVGSPGMESTRSAAFSVMIFDAENHASVYQKYPAK
ncbi:MAG TPA: DUF411 domain-containing protein [Terriglobales bacterium]|nr:DUF411 domain-containing protein [Terriglobales bacterium]